MKKFFQEKYNNGLLSVEDGDLIGTT